MCFSLSVYHSVYYKSRLNLTVNVFFSVSESGPYSQRLIIQDNVRFVTYPGIEFQTVPQFRNKIKFFWSFLLTAFVSLHRGAL